MSEMSNEGYESKLSNRIFDEEWELFNFGYELVFESDDVEKLKIRITTLRWEIWIKKILFIGRKE
jgi:hypothetical protein